MKKILILAFLIGFFTNCFSQFKVPSPQDGLFVNDYTNTLTNDQKTALLTKIKAFEKSSSIQIAIVVLDEFQGREIEDITLAIGREWGVGQKGLNNGILYLISPKNRKARIEVGPGLQSEITDAFTNEIQENVKNEYRKGNYFSGINMITDALIFKLKPISWDQRQTFKKQVEKEQAETIKTIFTWIGNIIMIILLSVLGVFFYNHVQKRKKEKLERLAGLKKKYLKAIEDLKELNNNFTYYSKTIPQIDDLISVIKLEITKKINFDEKSMLASLEMINEIFNAEQTKNCLNLISKEQEFRIAKNKVSETFNFYSTEQIENATKDFESAKKMFQSKKELYTQLFSKTIDEVEYRRSFNILKSEITSFQNTLETYVKDEELLKQKINGIDFLIERISNSFKQLNQITQNYLDILKKIDIKLKEISDVKKNFLKNFKSTIAGYKGYNYVKESTKQELDILLESTTQKYNEWISNSNSSIKNDLLYIAALTFNLDKSKNIYNIDFNVYEVERLKLIREEEERQNKIKKEREQKEEEERKARRKREQEEEDNRRRQDSYNSSYSSWNTNSISSSSDNSSFGGGSFDGGGGTSSW